MKTFDIKTALIVILSSLFIIYALSIEIEEKNVLLSKNCTVTEEEKQNISIFEKVKDSVVFISIHQQIVDYWNRSTIDIPQGAGSGFVWNKEGYIVTNYHVIMHANRAVVTLKNGSKYNATLVGAAPNYDIAVLKIAPVRHLLKPVDLGTSKNLMVGQTVYALGNPFGLDWTMTKGIISALDRSMHANNGATIRHMIQTDASINPGNSGGPLINSQGKVIGVNNMIISPSGSNAGIGFSIPIDTVKRVVNSIIKKGSYTRPTIGIRISSRMNALYKELNGKDGVVVVDVLSGTSAEKRRLKPTSSDHKGVITFGDVIISLNAKPVESIEDLFSLLDEHQSGETVTLEILREDKTEKIEIELQ
jgi:S1-C subfamily serine protease